MELFVFLCENVYLHIKYTLTWDQGIFKIQSKHLLIFIKLTIIDTIVKYNYNIHEYNTHKKKIFIKHDICNLEQIANGKKINQCQNILMF